MSIHLLYLFMIHGGAGAYPHTELMPSSSQDHIETNKANNHSQLVHT